MLVDAVDVAALDTSSCSPPSSSAGGVPLAVVLEEAELDPWLDDELPVVVEDDSDALPLLDNEEPEAPRESLSAKPQQVSWRWDSLHWGSVG